MFDLSSGKLILIGVIALVVVGPKELPGLLRQAGRAIAKLRGMAGEFRQQFDEAMREAELDDVAKLVTDVKGGLSSTVSGVLDPVTKLPGEIGAAATIGDLSTGTESGTAATATGGVSLDLPMPPEPPPIALPGSGETPAPKTRSRKKAVPKSEAGPVEAGPVEAGPVETSPAVASAAEASPAKAAPARQAAAKPKPAKAVSAKASPVKKSTTKAAPVKTAAAETAPAKTTAAKPAAKPKSPRRSRAAVSEEGA
jgi:sec-independent protein translocase protein TatB